MSSTFSNLKFELIGTGEQVGLWGATTNTNIGTAIEQAIVGMATLDAGDFTANVATLTLANTNAAQDARALCLVVSASALSAAGTINVPAIEKPYIVVNNDSYAVTVKVSGQTGVTVPAGKRSVVYNNGTDVGEQITYLTNLTIGTLTLASALPVVSGGTGAATLTGYVKGSGTSALTASATIPNTDITGLGTMSTQNAGSVAITGGAVDGTTVGSTTAAAVRGTTVTATTQFSGPGTGLTGTASGLSIGGNAATATSATTATTATTATSATSATNATNAANLVTSNFTVQESGGKLVFKYGSTTVFSISSTGAIIAANNVTGYGTP